MKRRTTRTTFGPMSILTAVIALGWAVLGVLSFLGLEPPAGIILGVVGAVGLVATAWLAWTMRIEHDVLCIVLRGRGRVPWEAVHSIEVQSGLVSVPVLTMREGRALVDVPLDGLAWFGRDNATTHALAERLAHDGGLGEVVVRPTSGTAGRRAA